MKSSLQSKISTALWGMAALSILTASFLTAYLLVRSHRESIRSQLEASAAALVSLGISDFSELEDFEELNLFIEDTLEMEKVDKIIRIFDPTGQMVFSTVGLDYDILPDRLDLTTHKSIERPVFLTLEGKQRRYEGIVVPYLGKGKKKPSYFQVVIPLPRYSQIFERLWWQDLILLMILVGISLIFSRRLAKRLLKPVALIAGHLQKMDPRRTDELNPLLIDDQDLYLGDIVKGINSLTERTRGAVLQLRNMGRFVAHEMRTPLTILRGEAETALSKGEVTKEDYECVLRSSLEEVQRMSDTVDTVLQVGEWDRKRSVFHPVSCDLVQWLGENKSRWQKTLGRPLVFIALLQTERPRVQVDLMLFDHLMDNLVRNVRDHTTVEVGCRLAIETNLFGTVVRLEDDGPGLHPSLIHSLNQRDGIPDEAGVGLNLCRKIAEILGLSLHFANRTEGGLVVEIAFNLSRP